MANNQSIIHKYKYLFLKQKSITEDIRFNKKCLQQEVVPNYIKINIKSKTKAALKTLEIAKTIWAKEEINQLYTKLHTIQNKLVLLEKDLRNHYHQETIDEILSFAVEWAQPILLKKTKTHENKLNKLISSQKKDNFTDELKDFFPTTQNLTDINFNDKELSMLEKALKYNINLDYQNRSIENDLINLDVAIRQKDKNLQDRLRYSFIHELDKSSLETNKGIIKNSKSDMNVIKSIGLKLKDNNAVIVKADKGNTTVIMEKEIYHEKMLTFIQNNNKFTPLTKDPTVEFNKISNNAINKCKSLTNSMKYKLKMNNPQAPTLRGLPKTHKTDIPMRPIVNYMNAPTYKVCKFLNRTIKTHLVWKEDYSLNNTYNLIERIKDVHIPDGCMFVSFDVKDMYSNIPTRETLEILKNDLTTNPNLEKNCLGDIVKLTQISMNQSYFEYEGEYFKQQDGLAMGSPLSGLLADIFMHDLETKKIINDNNPFKNQIIYWYRYVDDIICLLKGDEGDCRGLLDYLNNLSQNITFTIEAKEKEIHFLDISISNKSGKHEFGIFRKPTQSDLIIPASSNHPWTQKMAGFHSMINRLINIPLSKNKFEKEKRIIKQLAQKNGYKEKTIDNMIKKKFKRKNEKDFKKEITKKEYICTPFNTSIHKALRKTFHSTKFNLAYTTKNNAFSLMKKFSQKETPTNNDDLYKKSGIYKLNCNDCNKYYIGQTGRSFKCRFQEHIQALKSNNTTSMKSSFAEHLLTTNHSYTSMQSNMKIVEFARKGGIMDCKEDLHIYLNKKKDQDGMLNTTHLNYTNPIFDYIEKVKKQL